MNKQLSVSFRLIPSVSLSFIRKEGVGGGGGRGGGGGGVGKS